ncbi:MAG: type II secretion system protein GspD [Rubripirellula sp.]
MPTRSHNSAAKKAGGWAIGLQVLIALSILMTGCATKPPMKRPTVDDLIQQSLNQSLGAYEIDDPEDYADRYYDEFGNEIIDYGDPNGIVGSEVVELSPPPVDDYYDDQESEPTFTEDFIEMDVREALLALSEEADVDLVMGENVNGVVNARIDNLTLDRAIEKVLMPLGLHFARHGNQYIVASDDPESPLFSYIAKRIEYKPQHLESTALLDSVPTGMQQFTKSIAGANLIMVEAPTRIADEIVERFASIDQPVPQVVLEAIICVVEPDTGFQFGLDWEHAVELNGENALRFGATGLALSSNYSQAGANAIFNDFASTSSFVKLLKEHGYLTIRASPHVMAQDGKPAQITINRQTYFSVQQSPGNADNSAFFFQQDIKDVESGISLDITPHIRGDIVTIDITKAEVSEDIRNANSDLAVNPFPIINRRSVSTTVHVKDGKTIVIGGLVQRETVDRVNRIPGLSKIPLMGYLFETTQQQTREAEVVIFISPRIVTPKVMD